MRVCTGRDGLADAEQKNPSLAQWSSTSIDVHCRLLGSYIYIYVCMLPLLEAAPDRVKLPATCSTERWG